MSDIERNELNVNAKGGTELMAEALMERLDADFGSNFQIICSRVRDVDPDKVPILWLHDLPGDPESQHLADPESVNRFAKIVFVSHWQMNEYISTYNLPYEKCAVVKNAIEPIEYKERPQDGVTRLIYHSTPHRGLQLLIPVFEFFQNKYNIELDVYSSFNLYGWGERDEPYKDLFERMDANPKIRNHGTVSNDEIRKAVQKADIFAYPNIWPETSCLCLIEALAAGCLTVHPNYCALPETSADWSIMYQWIPDPNDHANMFASVLENVLESYNTDKKLPEAMLQYQSNYYNNHYSWDKRMGEWNQLLHSAMHEFDK